MINVGITEAGDAGLDFTWVKRLMQANVIISKELNNNLIDSLIAHKDKIIFHMTCTGLGGTLIEPRVPEPIWTLMQFKRLIANGFPVEQVVLRLDPIIPAYAYLQLARYVLDLFLNSGIKRVRYSFLDMYPHVVERFNKAGLSVPYTSFQPPINLVTNALNMLKEYEAYYTFECCAENTAHRVGCISQKDLHILGINKEFNTGGAPKRPGCLCPSNNKVELLRTPKKCEHGCLYCYWR